MSRYMGGPNTRSASAEPRRSSISRDSDIATDSLAAEHAAEHQEADEDAGRAHDELERGREGA